MSHDFDAPRGPREGAENVGLFVYTVLGRTVRYLTRQISRAATASNPRKQGRRLAAELSFTAVRGLSFRIALYYMYSSLPLVRRYAKRQKRTVGGEGGRLFAEPHAVGAVVGIP